jgi:hypothetical protein
MRTQRAFAPGIIDATREAVRRYRDEYTLLPCAVIIHPDDVNPDPPRVFGLTVVRSDSVDRGQVRVSGLADHGMAWVDG